MNIRIHGKKYDIQQMLWKLVISNTIFHWKSHYYLINFSSEKVFSHKDTNTRQFLMGFERP